jgi:hypothetical protein
MVFEEPTTIYYDNTSTISLSKNPVQHSKSKHIPIKYRYLRDRAENVKLDMSQHKNTWKSRNVEYLKQMGLIPLPVIKYGTTIKVIKSFILLIMRRG